MTGTMRGAKAPAKRRGRPIRREPLTDEPITSDQIRRAFSYARHPEPSDDEVSRLAGIFTQYKCVFLQARKDSDYTAAALEATEAIKTLQRVLPALFEYQDALVQAGDRFFAPKQRAQIRDLKNQIEESAPSVEWVPVVPGHEVKNWRWFIDVITGILEPSFPGKGVSQTGPIPLFLSRIIPLVTGEQITESAAATQIIKRRAGEK